MSETCNVVDNFEEYIKIYPEWDELTSYIQRTTNEKLAKIVVHKFPELKFITGPVGLYQDSVFVTKTYKFDTFNDVLHKIQEEFKTNNILFLYTIIFHPLILEIFDNHLEIIEGPKEIPGYFTLRLGYLTEDTINNEILPPFEYEELE